MGRRALHGRRGAEYGVLRRWRRPSHQEAPDVRAAIGDKIEARCHRVGEFDREAVILAEEPDVGLPYRVRWEDDGHEGVFFPGRMRSLSTTRSDDRDTERAVSYTHLRAHETDSY